VYSYKEGRESEGSGAQRNLRHREGVEAKAKRGEGWTQLGVPLHSPSIELIRFPESYEAYLLDVCHQYNFCSQCGVI